MTTPLDPDAVRATAADAARQLADRDAQDLVDGLRDLLDE